MNPQTPKPENNSCKLSWDLMNVGVRSQDCGASRLQVELQNRALTTSAPKVLHSRKPVLPIKANKASGVLKQGPHSSLALRVQGFKFTGVG